MGFNELRSLSVLAALSIFVAAPIAHSAADELHVDLTPSVGANDARETAVIGSPLQVTEDILQLRQSIGSAWRDVGGAPTPEATAAEEQAIRTALLDQARSNPIPKADPPPQAFCQKEALRDSAHQLDLVAHTLECQDLYDEADELRAIAQRLRLQARQKQPVVLRRSKTQWRTFTAKPAD